MRITEKIRTDYMEETGMYGTDEEVFKYFFGTTQDVIYVRGNGGSTSYYTIPDNAKELKDLIRHKSMSHAIGEAFCALYLLKDNGEELRNLKKALFYIQDEINFLEEKKC